MQTTNNRIYFYLNRIRERLWVKPLVLCVLSIGGVFVAMSANESDAIAHISVIEADTNEKLLTIMASSMLVIATFAVSSMLSAYASASNTATPRSFPLVVADDVSQTALSAFIGAFIFSMVALVAVKNGYFEPGGHFVLFVLTMTVFAWVVLTFVRWVDNIARLGRVGNTTDKVEKAASEALMRRRRRPNLGGIAPARDENPGQAVLGEKIGYVQQIDTHALQTYAEDTDCRIIVAAIPGTFLTPGKPIAYVAFDDADVDEIEESAITEAFLLGDDRVFDEDPRFGLVVLSEIASRALSPAVNDPGTTIGIIGTFVRLFAAWNEPLEKEEEITQDCDRVHVPELVISDMFDDAFTAIGRDGATFVEICVRLQKAFAALARMGNSGIADAARHHSRRALAQARRGLQLSEDIDAVRREAERVTSCSDPMKCT